MFVSPEKQEESAVQPDPESRTKLPERTLCRLVEVRMGGRGAFQRRVIIILSLKGTGTSARAVNYFYMSSRDGMRRIKVVSKTYLLT